MTTEFVTPQLRTVLKEYQDSAPKSLQGPGLSLVHPKKELLSPDDKANEVVPLIIPQAPPPPEISQPVLSAADTGRGILYETLVEGKPIGCFLLGGEMRLCLPQFLNNVLTDFTLDQINRIFDELRIFCSQCTPEQLNEFKAAKILPEDVKASGLITRTNAERLCSAMLHRPERRAHKGGHAALAQTMGAISFKVYHRCFGKCEGICTPDMYGFKDPACIECVECRGLFSPQKFVCHVHRRQENRTCHWGFDSANWRAYLHVAEDEENRDKYTKMLDDLRDHEYQEFAYASYQHIHQLQQQHRQLAELGAIKRKADMDDCCASPPLQKPPLHNLPVNPAGGAASPPPPPLPSSLLPNISATAAAILDIPASATAAKRPKYMEENTYLSNLEYQALMYAHQQMSAFRPWAAAAAAAAASSPRHLHLAPPPPPPHVAIVQPPPSHLMYHAYLSQQDNTPPVLQNPERVVRHTEYELFERGFQPNVALVPKRRHLERARMLSEQLALEQMPLATIKIKQEPIEDEPMSNNNDEHLSNLKHATSKAQIVAVPPPPLAPPTNCKTSPENLSGSNEITSSTSPAPLPATAMHQPTTTTHTKDQVDNVSPVHHLATSNIHEKMIKLSSPPPLPRSGSHQSSAATITMTVDQPSPVHDAVGKYSLATTTTTSNAAALVNGHVGRIPNNPVIKQNGSAELELSTTDSEDDSLNGEADSSNAHTTVAAPRMPWDIAAELMADFHCHTEKDKVLHIIRVLTHENAQLRQVQIDMQAENSRLSHELRQRDDHIEELLEQQQRYEAVIKSCHDNSSSSTSPHVIAGVSEANSVARDKSEALAPDCTKIKIEKVEPERICLPLKKSARRSPENTVVVMPPKLREEARRICDDLPQTNSTSSPPPSGRRLTESATSKSASSKASVVVVKAIATAVDKTDLCGVEQLSSIAAADDILSTATAAKRTTSET